MKMKDITLKNNNYKSYDLGVNTKIVDMVITKVILGYKTLLLPILV